MIVQLDHDNTICNEFSPIKNLNRKFGRLLRQIKKNKRIIGELKGKLEYEMSAAQEENLNEQLAHSRALLRRYRDLLIYVKKVYAIRLTAELEKVNAA